MENKKVVITPLHYDGNNQRYTAHIILIKSGRDIADMVENLKISLPTSSTNITSMKAAFSIEEEIVINKDPVRIEIRDEVGNSIYTLTGEAKITGRSRNYYNKRTIDIEVYDELEKLFEKQVSKDVFFFNQWLYNSNQKENSILYRIAKELGFEDDDMVFDDIRDSNSILIKVPFMIVREGNRWVDELHTLVECAKGMLYMDNGKLIFKNMLFKKISAGGEIYEFNSSNVLSSVREQRIYQKNNGVRVSYDSYKYLENQVVFDLAEKIEVKPNTKPEDQKLEFNIQYITDIVTQHNITSAQGYYYLDDTGDNVQRIDLISGIHYELVEFKESKAKVKFFNPYDKILYIDRFEVKGIPVAKYEDNEAVAKDEYITEEYQENFVEVQKNKYIQTEELAGNVARLSYKGILERRKFSFGANFLPGYEIGRVYGLVIDDIITKIIMDSIELDLSSERGFKINITASEYIEEEVNCSISITENQISKDRYLEDLQNKVQDLEEGQEEVLTAIGTRGFVDEQDPCLSKEIKEPDVWFNPSTKEFKVWRNNQWNPAREEDIPPALMTSLKAQAGVFRIGGNDVSAGIFFQYDNDPNNPIFGAADSDNLAQVSIDKKANVLIRNANNKLAFNMRNPENPSEITSQLLMGVYNADDERHKNTLFQVGDESTGTYMKFERGKLSNIIDGTELGTHLGNLGNMANNAQNTANTVNSNQNTGRFVINANTTFNGDASIVSKGTDETTEIRGGSISFTRGGKAVTVIRNMASGEIYTDSNGSGSVTFPGFKQPMAVLASIKNFNISQNVRTLECYAELVSAADNNRYRFYLRGREAGIGNPIQFSGSGTNSASSTVNAITTSLSSITVEANATNDILTQAINSEHGDADSTWLPTKFPTLNIITNPTYKVQVYRTIAGESETLVATYVKDYPLYIEEIGNPGYSYDLIRRLRVGGIDIVIPVTGVGNTVFNIKNITYRIVVSPNSTYWTVYADGNSVGPTSGNMSMPSFSVSFTGSYSQENITNFSGNGIITFIAYEL